tara:strand:- start:10439 stop:10591 length:153 start_codon:yes stop_codon:yes gene_type:complete
MPFTYTKWFQPGKFTTLKVNFTVGFTAIEPVSIPAPGAANNAGLIRLHPD